MVDGKVVVVVRTAAGGTGFAVDGTGFADVVWDSSGRFGNGMFTGGFVVEVGGAEAE